MLIILPILSVITIALDYIWINIVMGQFYLDAFSSFGRIVDGKFAPLLWAAGAVYLIIPAAILFFVVIPTASEPLLNVVLKGAFFGLCFYGLYDFTNLATIQAWSVQVTLVDIAWGTFLCAVLSAIGNRLSNW